MSADARTVLVTGASSGIGRATALRCARRGDRVGLLSRSPEVLEQVAQECRDLGAADTLVLTADVGVDAQVGTAVQRLLARWGRLDAVVHSAGVAAYGDTDVLPADVFEGVLRTNLLGAAAVARHVLPPMRGQGSGVLVLVGSVIGYVAVPRMTAYATSKWGVRGMARQLHLDNRDVPGLRVHHLSPGGVGTPIYAQAANVTGQGGRPPFPVYSADRVAARIVRLVDRPGASRLLGTARHTVQVGPVNGPMRLASAVAPALCDAVLGRFLALGALDLTTTVPVGTGNVLAPVPAGERVRGEQGSAVLSILRNVAHVLRSRGADSR